MKQYVICLVTLFWLYTMSVYAQSEQAQEQRTDSLNIMLSDTLRMNDAEEALFKKLSNIFKFRENRNRSEKERIYRYLQKLIKEERLAIDADRTEINRIIDSLVLDAPELKEEEPNATLQNSDALEAIPIEEDDDTKDHVMEALKIALIVIALLFGIRLLRSLLRRPKF